MPPLLPVPLQSKTSTTKTLPRPCAVFPRSSWEQDSREGILITAGVCRPSTSSLSPVSPELCFLLAWMLKFKVENGNPAGQWPLPPGGPQR